MAITLTTFTFGDRSISHYLFELSTLSFWLAGHRTVWYISFILLMYMIYPVIYPLVKKSYAKVLMYVVVVSAVFLEILLANSFPEFYLNTEVAIARIPIFVIGCFIAPKIYEHDFVELWHVVIWSLCLGSIRLVNIIFISSDNIYYEIVVRFSNIFFTLLIIVVGSMIIHRLPKVVNRILSWFGRKSLEFYLLHMMMISIYFSTGIGQNYKKVWVYFMVILPLCVLMIWGIGLAKGMCNGNK